MCKYCKSCLSLINYLSLDDKVASVAGVSKTYAKGTKLGGSAKNKEQREGVKRFLFLPTPIPFSLTSSPFLPNCFAHPRRAPSLARFFARLFDLRLEREWKWLPRRLGRTPTTSRQTHPFLQTPLQFQTTFFSTIIHLAT